jgi:hypothetical protein
MRLCAHHRLPNQPRQQCNELVSLCYEGESASFAVPRICLSALALAVVFLVHIDICVGVHNTSKTSIGWSSLPSTSSIVQPSSSGSAPVVPNPHYSGGCYHAINWPNINLTNPNVLHNTCGLMGHFNQTRHHSVGCHACRQVTKSSLRTSLVRTNTGLSFPSPAELTMPVAPILLPVLLVNTRRLDCS